MTGAILFANEAFAAMLGHSAEALQSLKFPQIFHDGLPPTGSAVAVMRVHGGQRVELSHADGSSVRAWMSNSALLRGDDPIALASTAASWRELLSEAWTVSRYLQNSVHLRWHDDS